MRQLKSQETLVIKFQAIFSVANCKLVSTLRTVVEINIQIHLEIWFWTVEFQLGSSFTDSKC